MDERTAGILALVRELPQHTITALMRNPRGRFERSFTGALLSDVASAGGLIPEGASHGGMANHYFVATALDGFRVALGFGEVSPHYATKRVILAHEQDGQPVDGGIRLVVPGDDLGGRSIFSVVDIELRSVPSTPAAVEGRSTFLDISGLVDKPHRYYASTMPRIPARYAATPAAPRQGEEPLPSTRYGGALLYELLEAAGIRLDPNITEDVLGKIIVARSIDGYAAVIAAGEIEPRFMNGNVLVALSGDDTALREDEGLFRLIIPYDASVGRSVKRLTSLELLNA